MKKKKTNIKTIIRQIVREEVAMAIKEVITELKQPIESQPQPKKIVEKKSFTNNSVLNDVLNETAGDEEWKTLGGGKFDSNSMNDILKSSMGIDNTDVVKDTAINAGVSPEKVPEHLEKALTRNYGDVMKAIDKKAKQKRGI